MLKKSVVFTIIIVFCLIILSLKNNSYTNTSSEMNAPTKDFLENVEITPTPNTENSLNNNLIESTLNSEVSMIAQDTSPTHTPEIAETETDIINYNQSEPLIGIMDLYSDIENFIYGTWQVEELLGFANSYNDASEYPTGQKIIGDEIIINKDLFSTKGFKNYINKQFVTKDPVYKITSINYNEDSFYRFNKIDLPDVTLLDEIKTIHVYMSSAEESSTFALTFFVVNNERLILLLEATCFELKRISN